MAKLRAARIPSKINRQLRDSEMRMISDPTQLYFLEFTLTQKVASGCVVTAMPAGCKRTMGTFH